MVTEWGTKIRESEKNNCNVNGKCVFFFTRFKRNTQNKNYGWKLKGSNFVVEKMKNEHIINIKYQY